MDNLKIKIHPSVPKSLDTKYYINKLMKNYPHKEIESISFFMKNRTINIGFTLKNNPLECTFSIATKDSAPKKAI